MNYFFLYFHTLKYLKLTQIFHRILKRFRHPRINIIDAGCTAPAGNWIKQGLNDKKILNKTDVCFLNHQVSIINQSDWNNVEQEKLWLYNLHYFDDLNAFDSDERKALQALWIKKWIKENPASKGGNGWEAYTLSLRIVNWAKSFLSGLEHDQQILNSLAQQADFLSQDLEKHLLGNHYFVNLKALIFAGCFLEGQKPSKWLVIGLKDFEKELNEQVLEDGGSFELTPMYHAIMLTDLLDLYNLFNTFNSSIPLHIIELTKNKIIKMLAWLNLMSLGDDKVSFFNDSTFDIAPTNAVLRSYASKLGFTAEKLIVQDDKLIVNDLPKSGYVSIKSKHIHLIADLAAVGPSYIPGHAHADSLSFEMSLGESRVFVNSGISQYGMSKERLRQRGTAAHNTVMINELNSSEVWSGFRVARRANIINRTVNNVSTNQHANFSAAHNGYKKLGINCIHHRSWSVSLTELIINDDIQGKYDSAIAHLHLHPDVNVKLISERECMLHIGKYEIKLQVLGAQINVEPSTWQPGFGVVIPSKKLILKYKQPQITYKINWKKL